MSWTRSTETRIGHRSRWLVALTLSSAALAVLCAVRPVSAQVVTYDGLVGIDKNGDPALNGPGVTPTEWYYPDDPLVVVNVPCPSSSATISETKTSTVKWSMAAGAKAGVDWGVVSAELSASFGIEIGSSHTIQISKTVPADAYVSKEVRVYTRYQKKQFSVFGRQIWVNIPVGWYEKHKDVPPSCPCKTAQAVDNTLKSYGQTLTPGSRLRDQVDRTTKLIDGVLASFDTVPADRLLRELVPGLEDSVLALEEARELGADPDVVEEVGSGLTRGTMDNIASGRMADADSTHILDQNELVRYNPFVVPGHAGIDDARAYAEDTSLGAGRFPEAASRYSEAFHLSRAARSLTYSDLTLSEDCTEPSPDPELPGDPCPDSASVVIDATPSPN